MSAQSQRMARLCFTPHGIRYYDMVCHDRRQFAGVVMLISIRDEGMDAASV